MARERPKASDARPVLVCLDGARPDSELPLLTRAEAHALRRSAPLTNAKLSKHLECLTASPQRVPASDPAATATEDLIGLS